jgi:hypothetical protein
MFWNTAVAAGFRNFMWSPEDFILHYAVRRFLCSGDDLGGRCCRQPLHAFARDIDRHLVPAVELV